MHVRIESRRRRLRERVHERLARAAALDEVTDELCFGHVADDEVLPTGIALDLRGRGARFLVVMLAVNEGGESVARIALDALPDVEHGAAGRVDDHATQRPQGLEV